MRKDKPDPKEQEENPFYLDELISKTKKVIIDPRRYGEHYTFTDEPGVNVKPRYEKPTNQYKN